MTVPIVVNLTNDQYRILSAIADRDDINVHHLIEAQIAAGLGFAPKPVARNTKNPRNLTLQQVNNIVRLHGQGMNDVQIGEAMSISSKTVATRRRRLNLPPNAIQGRPKQTTNSRRTA